MSKTSTALRRFGVGLLSAATIGAGLTALAPVANAATADITGLTITPTSATISTGEDPCHLYTIDVTESGTHTDGTLTVQLQPTGGVDSQFCGGDAPAPTNPNTADGGQDSADFVIGGDNQVVIGVNDQNGPGGAQGQIAIKAFPQNATTPGTPAAGAPVANATENILTADAQNDVVTQLAVDPASQSGTENDSKDYTVTATNGASSVVKNAYVYYTMKSSQGNSVGQDNVFCGTTDDLGQVDCSVTVPTTTSVQTGPYTITFKVPHNAAGEHNTSSAIPASNAGPTATATLNAISRAANGSTLTIACGDENTNRYSPEWCNDSRGTRSETVTATVDNPPAAGQTTGTPEAGVEVHFYVYNYPGDQPTVDPESCVTDASGTCSVTVTRPANDTGQSYFAVYAWIVTQDNTTVYNSNDNVYVEFGVGFESPATNIDGTPEDATADTGTTQTVRFLVTNQYDNPANETCFTDEYDFANAQGQSCDSYADTSGNMSAQIPVHVTITGTGTFSDGTTNKTINASNGVVEVAVTSSSAGTSTITGSLDPSLTDCTVLSGSDSTNTNNYNDTWETDPDARAGNCDDQVTVEWTGAQPPPTTKKEHPALNCWSPKAHVLKCKVVSHPRLEGSVAKFRKVHKDGTYGKVIARKLTDASGVAKFRKKHIRSGKVFRIVCHIQGQGNVRGGWSNVDKTRVK